MVNMLYLKDNVLELFQRFKNNYFDLENEKRGRLPKKFEDNELQALLDEDDS